MRIAICVSGHIRSFDQCHKTWKQCLPQANIDYFFHLWNSPWGGMVNRDYVSNVASRFTKSVELIIEPQIMFPIPQIYHDRNYNKRNINGMLSMLYKINACNKLKQEHERKNNFKYDCVFRMRPDIFLHDNIPPLDTTDLNKMQIPKYGDFGGLNDQMAWSNSENIDYYCELFNNVQKYLEIDQSLLLNPEYLIKIHMGKKPIIINRPLFTYQLMRENNQMLPDNKTREIQMGFIKSI